MFDDYPDILTVDEAFEILRIGYNSIYADLIQVNSAPIETGVYGAYT